MKKIVELCKRNNWCLVAIALLALLLPRQAFAEGYHCDLNEGYGKVFYNFDRIIVYYAGFSPEKAQNMDDYPSELRFNNFNKSLMQAIKYSFKNCLTTTAGREKPIDVYKKSDLTPEKLNSLTEDSDNLFIVISLGYRPKKDPAIDYGVAFFSFYRPGVKGINALPKVNMNPMYIVLTPHAAQTPLVKSLDLFFSLIHPVGKFDGSRFIP